MPVIKSWLATVLYLSRSMGDLYPGDRVLPTQVVALCPAYSGGTAATCKTRWSSGLRSLALPGICAKLSPDATSVFQVAAWQVGERKKSKGSGPRTGCNGSPSSALGPRLKGKLWGCTSPYLWSIICPCLYLCACLSICMCVEAHILIFEACAPIPTEPVFCVFLGAKPRIPRCLLWFLDLAAHGWGMDLSPLSHLQAQVNAFSSWDTPGGTGGWRGSMQYWGPNSGRV